MIEPKYNELRTASNLIGQTSNLLEPRFVHQNQTSNPFELLQKAPTLNLFGQKQAQNLDKPNFVPFQILVRLPKPNYKPYKNPELRTHNISNQFFKELLPWML